MVPSRKNHRGGYHRKGTTVGKGWLRHPDFIMADLTAMILSLSCVLFMCRYYSWEVAGIARLLVVLIPLIRMTACILTNSYDGILQRNKLEELVMVCKTEILTFFLLIFVGYFLEIMTNIFRKTLITYFLCSVPLTFSLRRVHKFFLCCHYNNEKYARQVVVVTIKKTARQMICHITESATKNYQFSGLVILDEYMSGQVFEGITVSADRDTMINYMRQNVVDEVFINIPDDSASTLKLSRTLLDMGIMVHICMDELYVSLPNRSTNNIFGYNVLTSTISPVSFYGAVMKRMLDIAGGMVGCLMAILIGFLIGPLIFINSPGPILFTQMRVGKNGRLFKMYKFRSMYLDAEERKKDLMKENKIQHGLMFKMDNDPRVIKGIGNFIRRTSLDEFPQFWNVLKGDMSMVGTRPPTADEYEKYSPHHKRRLSMQPGITGLWQVSGHSNITDFEEVVRLDTEYIANWSLKLDIWIILKTLIKMWKN